jgi:hypothetical protein
LHYKDRTQAGEDMNRILFKGLLAALILCTVLSGCLPASVEPMVYEDAVGLPESWLGEWQYVAASDESPGDCGIDPVVVIGRSGPEWHAQAFGCGESYGGRFVASKVPGTDIRVLSFSRFTVDGDGGSEDFKNVFFLARKRGDRLYCWDLLHAGLGTLPWGNKEVRHWLETKGLELADDKAGLVFQRTH